MSLGADLLNTGWDALLSHHETQVKHVPASGGAVQVLSALDNGQPEDVAALAMGVEGVSRVISVTRSTATFRRNDSVWIGGTRYYILGVRQRSAQATDILLGASEVAGKQ